MTMVMLSDGYDPVVFGRFCLAGDDDPGLDSMYFFLKHVCVICVFGCRTSSKKSSRR